MNPLQQFYADKTQKEAVKTHLVESLKELIILKAFRGEETTGSAEAKAAIEHGFAKLEEMFGEKKKEIKKIIR